jgi:PAS domain S-box-containing protein
VFSSGTTFASKGRRTSDEVLQSTVAPWLVGMDDKDNSRGSVPLTLFRTVIRCSLDGIIIIDGAGTILEWNDGEERITGIARAEAVGRPVWDVQHRLEPDEDRTADHLLAARARVLRGLAEGAELRRDLEERIQRSDGGRRVVRSLLFHIQDGEEMFACGISRDVTAQRQAEDARRRRERELQLIADHVPALVSYVGADTRYRYVNRRYEEWFGLPRSEIVGQSFLEILGGAASEQIAGHVQAVLSGRRVRFEQSLPYCRGGARWVVAEYVPDVGDDGAVRGFYALVTDVTDRKLAERRELDFARRLLSAREEEKARLSAILHHEVGSFAVGVASRIDAAEEALHAGDSDQAIDALAECRGIFARSVERLKTLAVEQRPPDLDLLGLSAALRQHVAGLRRETSLRARFEDATRRREIGRDAQTVLFRAAQECLTNVVKHAHARRVRVRLTTARRAIRLVVADDGVGFDPAQVAARPGSRLGLRATREMLAALGGQLEIDAAPGRGTTVRVTVPLAEADR